MHSALYSERLEILNYMKDTFLSDISRDVLQGLTSAQKSIPSKYFYDAYGSELFEEICRLPEYYHTRTELSILNGAAGDIVRRLDGADIVELGSGSNRKIRTLLDECVRMSRGGIRYIPVDVSEAALVDSSVELLDFYPDLRIVGVVADFMKHIGKIPGGRERLFLFLGSTIGNFPREEAIRLLKRVAEIMGPADRFLLGIDMVKRADVLERAYNDSRGVTSEFNKNVLNVVNRELGADFNPSHFDHVAFYDADKERVEMHLRANRSVSVTIDGLAMRLSFEKGETIRTEICEKFSRKSAEAMAEEAGLRATRWFADPQGWFSLVELAGAERE